ncbi:hypothetical protein EII34_15100 [Arachnia propionica]|uniref:Uncharacterized protein n=1 Tax=Arachnia propionica TaxID=1750 RepID=A0A3P1T1F3_9ACTN|nr:hypothetical protein [Arachnia propionica]RRD03230.1 hypothetical protein EII34_15100 [Arachnia propionica]
MSKRRAYRRPAGAPKPQDHKPKQGTPEVFQVEALGRTWTIDADKFDDDELIEWLGELQSGENPFVLAKVGRFLLGEGEYEEARELLRDPETGRVKFSDIAEFIKGVLSGGNA